MDARVETNIHNKTIDNLEDWIRNNYLQMLEQKDITFSSKLRFRLVINNSEVEILEEYSQQNWTVPLKFEKGRLKNSSQTR